MKNTSDKFFYGLAFAGYLLPFLLLAAFRYSSGIVSTVGSLILFAVFSYAAFWGFSMRESLAAPLYRRQAFWVGAVGAFFAGQWLAQAIFDPFYPYGGTAITRFILDSFNNTGYTMIFAWISATMPLVRESDPLLQDRLRWRRLKLILWPIVLLGATASVGLFAFALVTGVQYPILLDLVSSLPYPVILLGSLGLGAGIKRSTDVSLRKQLKWFGLSATLIVVVFLSGHFARTLGLVPASAALLVQALQYTAISLAGVLLFKSAKNLVPVFPTPIEANQIKVKAG